jgi:AcrR family transcriptional regulator
MPREKNNQVILENIIEAAVPIFMEKGYLGTSMREIATSLGVKAASLYYHIKSKEELLEKIYDLLINELLVRSKKIVDHKDISAKKKFELFLTDLLKVMTELRPYATVFFRDHHFLSPYFSRQIKEKRKIYQKIFQEILKEGIKGGEFKNVDVTIASLGIFGMFMWAHMWTNANEELQVEEIAKIFSDILFRGICLL